METKVVDKQKKFSIFSKKKKFQKKKFVLQQGVLGTYLFYFWFLFMGVYYPDTHHIHWHSPYI